MLLHSDSARRLRTVEMVRIDMKVFVAALH
jgi:hypothetical protein